MHIVLFGATGMVGKGVLLEALDDPAVSEVLAVGRSATGVTHAKLREAQHADFTDFSGLKGQFAGLDACFFCLGVSAAGVPEQDYALITHDFTIAAAQAVAAASPGAVFTYVSGAGTDEHARAMWARIKGRTENELLAMPGLRAVMFRPAFIRPERGVQSRTMWYRWAYAATAPLAGILERSFPEQVTGTTAMGQAMLAVAEHPPEQRVLGTRDINGLAAARKARAAPKP